MPVGAWNWPWCPKVYAALDNGPYDEQDIDLFDRSNNTTTLGVTNTVAQPWLPKAGVWGISSNQAYLVTASLVVNHSTALITGGNNGTLQVQMGAVTPSNEPGVVFRARDEHNYWTVKVGFVPYETRYYLELHDGKAGGGGGTAALISIEVPTHVPAANDLIVIGLNGPTITVTINGTLRLTTSQTALQSASLCGLLQKTAGSTRFSSMRFDFNNVYNLSPYVLDDGGILINRGRKQELDEFAVTTCSLTLNNKNGVFDPSNTSSPFYGKMKLRSRIWVEMLLDDSFSYRRFTGHIMRWPQFDGRGFNASYVQLECAGPTGLLGLSDLSRIYWNNYISSLNVWAWYRVNESGVPTAAGVSPTKYTPPVIYDFSGNNRHLNADPGLTRVLGGADSLNEHDKDSKSLNLGLVSALGAYRIGQAIVEPDAGFTMAFFIQVEPMADMPINWLDFRQLAAFSLGDSRYKYMRIQVWDQSYADPAVDPNTTFLELSFQTSASVFTRVWSNNYNGTKFGFPLADGKPHFVILSYSVTAGVQSITMTIDGIGAIWKSTSSGTKPTDFGFTDMSLFGPSSTVFDTSPIGIHMDEVVMWDRQLSTTERTALTSAALTPGEGDYAYSRLHKVADWVRFPQNMREFQASTITTLALTSSMDKKALTEMQRIARADLGALYDTKQGKVKFRDRQQPSKPPKNYPAYTFADDGTGIAYTNLVPTQGDEKVLNIVTVKNSLKDEYTAFDLDSIDKYGSQAEQIDDSYALTSVSVQDQAEWMVTLYSDPDITFQSMRVVPMNSLTVAQAVVNIDIETMLKIKRTRPGAGATLNRDVVVQGYRETIDRSQWVIDYNTTGSLQAGSEFMVLDDANNGIVGSNRVGY